MKLYRKKYQVSGVIKKGTKTAQEDNAYDIDPFEKTMSAMADLYRQKKDPNFKIDTTSNTFYTDEGLPDYRTAAFFMRYPPYSDKIGVLASNNVFKHNYDGNANDSEIYSGIGKKDSIAGILNHEINHAFDYLYSGINKENPLYNTRNSPVFIDRTPSVLDEKTQKDLEYLYNVNTMHDFLKNDWYTNTNGATEEVPGMVNYMSWLSNMRNVVDPETVSALDKQKGNIIPDLFIYMNYETPFGSDYPIPKYPTNLIPYFDVNNPALTTDDEHIYDEQGNYIGATQKSNFNEEWGATYYPYDYIPSELINATYALYDSKKDKRTDKEKLQEKYKTDIYKQKIKDLVNKSEYRKLSKEEQNKLEELRNDYMNANIDNKRKQELNSVKKALWYTGIRKYGGSFKQKYQTAGQKQQTNNAYIDAGGLSERDRVRNYQVKLNNLGANLRIDGIWGKNTQAAYEKYVKNSAIDSKRINMSSNVIDSVKHKNVIDFMKQNSYTIPKLDNDIPQEKLQTVPLTSYNNTETTKPKEKPINIKEDFKNKMEIVRSETEKALKQYYKTDNVEVSILEIERSPLKQQLALSRGYSKTALGLHNLGLAADFKIKIDGKIQKGITQKELEPYKILGGVVKDIDPNLFWGWSWDSGHVGYKRHVYQAIDQHKELAEEQLIRDFYERHKEEAEAKYKKVLLSLDKRYGKTYNRVYRGNEEPEEELLTPIFVNPKENKVFKGKKLYYYTQ